MRVPCHSHGYLTKCAANAVRWSIVGTLDTATWSRAASVPMREWMAGLSKRSPILICSGACFFLDSP